MDVRAKDLLTCAKIQGTWRYKNPLFWYKQWALSLGFQKQDNVNSSQIYSILLQWRISDYWKTHSDMPINDMSLIDWKPVKQAVKGLPMGKQRWQTKFVTGFIGHYSIIYDRREMKSPACCLCEAGIKVTSYYIMLCPNEKAVSFFDHRI